jgi:heterodisulfide reductase subunit B2
MHNEEITMKLGYFPGCSLHATAREYEESLRVVLPALDITLEEIQDWACCGATSAHATNHTLGVALPARTLMQAEKQNLNQIFAPCAACYNRLASAQHALAHDKTTASRVQSLLGHSFANPIKILSIAQLLSGLTEEIRKSVKNPLKSVKVACYYGCLLVRPPEICKFDDPEAPSSLENIVSATGATPVRWDMALECCGGGFSLSRTASVVRLSRAILRSARRAGAQALAVACPMCHSNLDFRQQAINRLNAGEAPMPILFISQLVGLSLGLKPTQLGLERHFVNPQPFLNSINATTLQPERREQA